MNNTKQRHKSRVHRASPEQSKGLHVKRGIVHPPMRARTAKPCRTEMTQAMSDIFCDHATPGARLELFKFRVKTHKMRLPRRVPWASLADLDQVCAWIYADESDTSAKIRALNRLSAWKAITHLPHALEAVLSLLSAIILDETCLASAIRLQRIGDGQSTFVIADNSSALNVRQSYATAIVRVVNGLVDPLQFGTYARSIASIAAQIGLPQWLVELRHAVTHEDLPSLEVLRTGARESLAWLLHNYFLSVLSSAYPEQPALLVPLSPFSPLLKRYKSIAKAISRDVSLETQYKDELTKCLRDIERWIGEARVTCSSLVLDGSITGDPSEEEDENERWALERLCAALLGRGGLVPVSTRKRLASNSKSVPTLPSGLIAIWTPLLSALKVNHPSLSSVLVSAIMDFLLLRPSTEFSDGSSSKNLSYELCLAAWGAWCVDNWETSTINIREESVAVLKRRDIVVQLVSALAIRNDESSGVRRGANALLRLLVHSDPTFEEISSRLLSVARRDTFISTDIWTNDRLQLMEERLSKLLSANSSSTLEEVNDSSVGMDVDQKASVDSSVLPTPRPDDMPKGWRSVHVKTWRPCPIGVFGEPA